MNVGPDVLVACRPSALRSPAQRLLQRQHRQAINTAETPIAADQRRTEGERRRGHLQVVFVQSEVSLLAEHTAQRASQFLAPTGVRCRGRACPARSVEGQMRRSRYQCSIRGTALIRSLIAFVSRR